MRKRILNNRKLSIYLIKDSYRDFASVVKGNPEAFDVSYDGKTLGTLYVKKVYGRSPGWLSFFANAVQQDLQEQLKSNSVSAVFLLQRQLRIFAITFGYGRSLLRPGSWEERFGLKVVLNSIDRDKVRIIDRKNLDTMLTQTRTQTSRKCSIEEFNLDVQQILLKAVTGEPKDKAFASCISGADILSITCPVTLGDIESKCDELLKAFISRDYQKAFPWINNVSEVANKRKIEELNEELILGIKEGNLNHVYLAIPDIVEWTAIEGFRFRDREGEIHKDIFLKDFLETVKDTDKLTSDYLKHRHVYQIHSDNGMTEERWTVYRCINCEIIKDNKTYILTEGKWYEIDSSFIAQVNEQMNKVQKHTILFPSNKDEKESDYCIRLQESDKSCYALMDRKLIQHGGGHSRIELCDLFTKDKKFIHLKRYSGSSVLSHLFTQGVNSARVFLSDMEFRKKANEKLPASHKVDIENMPVSRDYEVIFGIISESADSIPHNLPFFSKITLMRAMQELMVMGFRMSVSGIKVTENSPINKA